MFRVSKYFNLIFCLVLISSQPSHAYFGKLGKLGFKKAYKAARAQGYLPPIKFNKDYAPWYASVVAHAAQAEASSQCYLNPKLSAVTREENAPIAYTFCEISRESVAKFVREAMLTDQEIETLRKDILKEACRLTAIAAYMEHGNRETLKALIEQDFQERALSEEDTRHLAIAIAQDSVDFFLGRLKPLCKLVPKTIKLMRKLNKEEESQHIPSQEELQRLASQNQQDPAKREEISDDSSQKKQ